MNYPSQYKATFNGVDLSHWLTISDVTRNVGQNRKATLIKVGTNNGKRFVQTSADESTIVVKGDMIYQLASQRRELAATLATKQPAKLVFDDEPDVYYMAIADQQTTMAEDQFLGEVAITFIVPDGLAHAVEMKSAAGASDTDIVVNNMGSTPTAPILTATMTGDNGLVAWTNDQGGVLQFGNPNEIDGTQHDDSQMAYHFDFLSAPTGVTLNKTITNYPNYLGNSTMPNSQVGVFDYNNKSKDAATPVYNRAKTDKWAGPSLYTPIKANSLGSGAGNFIFENRLNISTSAKAAGRAEFNLLNGNSIVATLVVRDSQMASDELQLEFWCQGQNLYVHALNRRLFTDGFYDASIRKLGDTITFKFAKINSIVNGVHTNDGATVMESYTIGGLSDATVDGMNAWFAGFSNSTGWTVNWSDSYFQWVNVDFWQDLPNRFATGDVVVADVASRTVMVNGVEDPTLQTVGNMWESFVLQSGENDIMPVASSWATPFNATIQWREADY